MAIPRKIGLPSKPPTTQSGNNVPEQPKNAPVSRQDQLNDQQLPSRIKTSQNAEKRVSLSTEERAKEQRSSRGSTQSSTHQKNSKGNSSQDHSDRSPERKRVNNTPKPVEKKKEDPEVEEGYAIDEETGIKYRVLPGAKPEAIKKFNSLRKSDLEKLTFSSMKYYFTEAEDFDVEDLNSAADDFLAHLRVPPDKEEQKRLREDRAKRKREQNKKYSEEQERLTAKYGSLEPDEIDDDS